MMLPPRPHPHPADPHTYSRVPPPALRLPCRRGHQSPPRHRPWRLRRHQTLHRQKIPRLLPLRSPRHRHPFRHHRGQHAVIDTAAADYWMLTALDQLGPGEYNGPLD
ncbi:hypothetical protein LshimejAT787_2201010 [Lyophyllum shimeji]|uniref:Uncharacterized protein n=1 Tax=Lyophyllum shimeji TaxID=47721 RepID=A0A9P3Q1K1_LYOSH|nr:hypothetical protein LshimejAT787_2201010 [Lyophyllum shimeji]